MRSSPRPVLFSAFRLGGSCPSSCTTWSIPTPTVNTIFFHELEHRHRLPALVSFKGRAMRSRMAAARLYWPSMRRPRIPRCGRLHCFVGQPCAYHRPGVHHFRRHRRDRPELQEIEIRRLDSAGNLGIHSAVDMRRFSLNTMEVLAEFEHAKRLLRFSGMKVDRPSPGWPLSVRSYN